MSGDGEGKLTSLNIVELMKSTEDSYGHKFKLRPVSTLVQLSILMGKEWRDISIEPSLEVHLGEFSDRER